MRILLRGTQNVAIVENRTHPPAIKNAEDQPIAFAKYMTQAPEINIPTRNPVFSMAETVPSSWDVNIFSFTYPRTMS